MHMYLKQKLKQKLMNMYLNQKLNCLETQIKKKLITGDYVTSSSHKSDQLFSDKISDYP